MEKPITGIMVYYYVVCKRKLWYFSHDITMEDNSEAVKIGKFLDEDSYGRMDKHILIDNAINIDFIKSDGVLHEIKKSRKIEEAGIWQVKYYIYYLKKLGLKNISGQIDYPLLRQSISVELSEEDETVLKNMLADIRAILDSPIPFKQREPKAKCKQCAFFDLCYI